MPKPRPPAADQLDLFTHSQDVALRNAVLAALEQRQAAAAQQALTALAQGVPGDPNLAAFALLTDALAQHNANRFSQHEQAAPVQQQLVNVLTPAARQAMGPQAGTAWLHQSWNLLAQRCANLPFVAAQAPSHATHAAACWLHAQAWPQAAEAVLGIESWRRNPTPLAWRAQALCCMGATEAAWPLLAELGWMAPARLRALLLRTPDAGMQRLHALFEDRYDGSDDGTGTAPDAATNTAWFVAWVLVEKPALAPCLALAQAGQNNAAERGFRLLTALLGLEREGRHTELVQQRKSLRDLNPALYALYMETR